MNTSPLGISTHTRNMRFILVLLMMLAIPARMEAKEQMAAILAGPLDSTGEEAPKQITIFSTTISEIKWTNWGTPTARGVGHIKECHDGSKCVGSAKIVTMLLDRPETMSCGDVPFILYQRLRVQYVGSWTTIKLADPKHFC